MVSAEAKRQGLPEPLGLAVARQESNFNPRALSDQGAMGVMQVLPATARSLGFKGPVADLFKPEVNIPLGITYLKQGYDEGGAKWAALRYHGGPDTRIHGPKTRRYAAVVLAMAGMDANGWIARGTTKIAMAEVRSWSSFN